MNENIGNSGTNFNHFRSVNHSVLLLQSAKYFEIETLSDYLSLDQHRRFSSAPVEIGWDNVPPRPLAR